MMYTIGRLRRIRWTNWPIPIAPVSPSPLTPIASIFPLASSAPVPTDGIRPWTELNPCASPRKYAGVLLEQPMPDSLSTRFGSMPISKHASITRSEMALCPQPAHSVVLPPRYGAISSPRRFFLASIRSFPSGSPRGPRLVLSHHRHNRGGHGVTCRPRLAAFLNQDFVGHRSRVDRQAVVMKHASRVVRRIDWQIGPQEHLHLGVAVLLDHVNARIPPHERRHFVREGIRADPQVGRTDPGLLFELHAALDDRPVARAVSDDADLRLGVLHDRLRHQLFRRLLLAHEPIHVALVVVGPLAVLPALVVPRTAREVRRHPGAGQGA